MAQPHRIDNFNEKQQIHFSVVFSDSSHKCVSVTQKQNQHLSEILITQTEQRQTYPSETLRKQVKQKTNVRGLHTDGRKRRSRRQLFSSETLITEREEAEDDYTGSETLITERGEQRTTVPE